MSVKADDLSLYMFPSCPFCVRVFRALERHGLEVDLRNINREAKHRSDLIDARGRATVPVLRIAGADGEPDVWMPESADIVAYIDERFAGESADGGLGARFRGLKKWVTAK